MRCAGQWPRELQDASTTNFKRMNTSQDRTPAQVPRSLQRSRVNNSGQSHHLSTCVTLVVEAAALSWENGITCSQQATNPANSISSRTGVLELSPNCHHCPISLAKSFSRNLTLHAFNVVLQRPLLCHIALTSPGESSSQDARDRHG